MIAFQSAFVVQTWLLPFNVTMPGAPLYPAGWIIRWALLQLKIL
jgi:hypothetical protein